MQLNKLRVFRVLGGTLPPKNSYSTFPRLSLKRLQTKYVVCFGSGFQSPKVESLMKVTCNTDNELAWQALDENKK